MNITLTGDLGSGKSSVSKVLVEQGYEYITVGALFRDEALRRGVTVVELNKMAETDPTIDATVDNMQREMGKIKDNAVFDSRLAFHFVPDAYSVYMYCNINEAAQRVYKDKTRVSESNTDLVNTVNNMLVRKQLEVSRYKSKYDVDYTDLANFDLVVDTTYATPENVAQLILSSAENNETGIGYLCPMNVYPTQVLTADSMKMVNAYREELKETGCLPPISVIYGDDGFMYVEGGHMGLLAAIMEHKLFVKARIISGKVKSSSLCCKSLERLGGFKYNYYPNFK